MSALPAEPAPSRPAAIPTAPAASAPGAEVHALPNGLRIVAVPMPWRHTASLSVFVRTGSLHESRMHNGISHVVEHMAFKGTSRRDCQRINLDAERLGAEVNAHTDKDHTAFHVEGLPRDLSAFVDLLADIVRDSTFPADELERERRVIEQEFAEVEDDPENMAFQQFDRACYGQHPAAQPVIGNRGNLRRFSREDLLAYVRRQYTACNIVVGVAGPVDTGALVAMVERAFGDMPRGLPNEIEPPAWLGGVKLRRMGTGLQCHTVLGFEAPPLGDEAHLPFVVAAAVLGEGMSSPLLDEIRERRGLAYHAGCSADILPVAGQFIVEGATEPAHAEAFLEATGRLLRQQAESLDPLGLERARNQLTVRTLRSLEQASRRLEGAALDLFVSGRLRDTGQWIERLQAVDASQVRDLFAGMLAGPAAIGLAGQVPERAHRRAAALFSAP